MKIKVKKGDVMFKKPYINFRSGEKQEQEKENTWRAVNIWA